MEKLLFYIIIAVAGAIIKIVHYIEDERREQQGLPSKHREYMGSLTDGMDFIEHYRSDLDEIKAAQETDEAQRRAKYVYRDNGNGMDNIEPIGTINRRTTEESDKMDTL